MSSEKILRISFSADRSKYGKMISILGSFGFLLPSSSQLEVNGQARLVPKGRNSLQRQ